MRSLSLPLSPPLCQRCAIERTFTFASDAAGAVLVFAAFISSHYVRVVLPMKQTLITSTPVDEQLFRLTDINRPPAMRVGTKAKETPLICLQT